MKNLGGHKQGIFIFQRKYVLEILIEVGMLECKPIDTPIAQNHRLREYLDQTLRTQIDKGRYQALVGKLICLSHTHLDVAYVVSVVSQSMDNPSKDHVDHVT